jgi:hypothetical protein
LLESFRSLCGKFSARIQIGMLLPKRYCLFDSPQLRQDSRNVGRHGASPTADA